ncbi:MAG: hypothetical protein HY275_06895 [Gemmatimonadetes bacterium]|nr:hypothetical protein [Gemmatimonadota bacterium]
MDDRQLDALLADAQATYEVPPTPPLDALWARIEDEAFRAPARAPRRGAAWWMVGMAAAASLTIGVLAGRLSMGRPVTTQVAADTHPAGAAAPGTVTPVANVSNDADPGERVTEELLGRTALLLAALPARSDAARGNPRLADQAGKLLTTTRLLLDAPGAQRPQLRALLQDLELVLVQVAQLKARRASDDLTIIREAVEERALVPRIRSAVAVLSGGSE